MDSGYKLRHEDYQIGWICALPIEGEASRAMLDEQHPPLDGQAPNDNNTYALGKISNHPVVIACLPKGSYGISSATSVLTNMRSSFHEIKFCLMVGIGGGVPFPSDVHLGDVVVGTPEGSSSGIIAYEHGKAVQGESEIRLGDSQNRPPDYLLTAISHLSDINRELAKKVEEHSKQNPNFKRLDTFNDWLFEADYVHQKEEESCEKGCDLTHLARLPREDKSPHVHCGIIGSAHKVVKNALLRDRLAELHKIKCVEMEAAGLVNQIPSLVIRGVCDYADSHKRKEWQPYASLTAATYAKLLLSRLPVRRQARVNYSLELSKEDHKCLQFFNNQLPAAHRDTLKRIKGERCAKTCTWLLKTDALETWKKPGKSAEELEANVLWLHGLPATGKSIMSIFLTEEFETEAFRKNSGILTYFFCDSIGKTEERKTTAASVLVSLVSQLARGSPRLQEIVLTKYREMGDPLFTSDFALWNVFLDLAKHTILSERESYGPGELFCIIDALDECDHDSQDILMKRINKLFARKEEGDEDEETRGSDQSAFLSHIHILITSRPYKHIENQLEKFPNRDLNKFEEAKTDVKRFIQKRAEDLKTTMKFNQDQHDLLLESLCQNSGGSFLWVDLTVQSLKKTLPSDFDSKIRTLPQGLMNLYQSLLDDAIALNTESRQAIKYIVDLVAVALKPLTILELATVYHQYQHLDISNGKNPEECDCGEELLVVSIRNAIKDCGLLIIEHDDSVILLHKSVQDFVFRENNNRHCAHANMASQCITYLANALDDSAESVRKILPHDAAVLRNLRAACEGEDRRIPDFTGFLMYSIRFWMEHSHFAGESFIMEDDHERFLGVESKLLPQWLGICRFTTYGPIPQRFTIFHVAARWGILPLLKLRIGKESYSETRYLTSNGTSLLGLAAQHGHTEIVRWLLTSPEEEKPLFMRTLISAARNWERGDEIMSGLLQHPAARLSISVDVLRNAAENEKMGHRVLKVLLNQPNVAGMCDDTVFRAAVENEESGELIVRLLRAKVSEIGISHWNLESAAKNRERGEFILRLLLDVPDIEITARVVEEAAGNGKLGPALFAKLLKRQGTVSEKTWDMAARDPDTGLAKLKILFARPNLDFTPGESFWHKAIYYQPADAIDYLFEKKAPGPKVTQEVINALADRLPKDSSAVKHILATIFSAQPNLLEDNDELLCYMFESLDATSVNYILHSHSSSIKSRPEDLYTAAATNTKYDLEVLNSLLEYFRAPIEVNEQMLVAAMGERSGKYPAMKLILDNGCPGFPITHNVLNSIARNDDTWTLLDILFDRDGGNLEIIQPIVDRLPGSSQDHILQWMLTGKAYILDFVLGVIESQGMESGFSQNERAALNKLRYEVRVSEAKRRLKEAEDMDFSDLLEVEPDNEYDLDASFYKIVELAFKKNMHRKRYTITISPSALSIFVRERSLLSLQILFLACGDTLCVKEDLLIALVRDEPIYFKVNLWKLKIIFQYKPTEISEGLVRAAAEGGNIDALDYFRSMGYTGNLPFTTSIIKAVLVDGEKPISWLLQGNDILSIEGDLILDVVESLGTSSIRATLRSIFRSIEEEERLVVTEQALLLIIESFEEHELIERVLNWPSSNRIVLRKRVEAAAKNCHCPGYIIDVLLDTADAILSDDVPKDEKSTNIILQHCSDSSIRRIIDGCITAFIDVGPVAFEAIISNDRIRHETVRLLLPRIAHNTPLTERVMRAIIQSQFTRTFTEYFMRGQREIPITQGVVQPNIDQIAGGCGMKISEKTQQQTISRGVISLLSWERSKDQVKVTKDGVRAVFRWLHEDAVKQLLKRTKEAFRITDDIMDAIVQNRLGGEPILKFLISQRRESFCLTSEGWVMAMKGSSDSKTRKLVAEELQSRMIGSSRRFVLDPKFSLDLAGLYGDIGACLAVLIPDAVLEAVDLKAIEQAMAIPCTNSSITEKGGLLLSRRIVTSGVSQYQGLSSHIIQSLLNDKDSAFFSGNGLNQEILAQNLSSWGLQALIIEWENRFEETITITPEMAERMGEFCSDILGFLHDDYRIKVVGGLSLAHMMPFIHYGTLKTILGSKNWEIYLSDLPLTLPLRQELTPTHLRSTYRRHPLNNETEASDPMVLKKVYLLAQQGERLLQVNSHLLRLLLLVEEAVLAIEEARGYRKKTTSTGKRLIAKLLLANIHITSEALSFIISKFEQQQVFLTLDCHISQITKNEMMISKLAARFGEPAISLLLDRHGQFVITEQNFMKAAGDKYYGVETVKRFLLIKPPPMVTEAVFEAAAANESHAMELLQILFKHVGTAGAPIEISHRTIISSLRGGNGRNILKFLHDKGIRAHFTSCTLFQVFRFCSSQEDFGLVLALRSEKGQVKFHESWVLLAAQLFGLETLRIFLAKYSNKQVSNNALINAAARNTDSKVLLYLMRSRRDWVDGLHSEIADLIFDELDQYNSSNNWRKEESTINEVRKEFLTRYSQDTPVTREMVKWALSGYPDHELLLSMLQRANLTTAAVDEMLHISEQRMITTAHKGDWLSVSGMLGQTALATQVADGVILGALKNENLDGKMIIDVIRKSNRAPLAVTGEHIEALFGRPTSDPHKASETDVLGILLKNHCEVLKFTVEAAVAIFQRTRDDGIT